MARRSATFNRRTARRLWREGERSIGRVLAEHELPGGELGIVVATWSPADEQWAAGQARRRAAVSETEGRKA